MSFTTVEFQVPKTPAGSTFTRSIYDVTSEKPARQRRLKSARLVGTYEKPWIEGSIYKSRERWDKVILWGCIAAGFGFGGLLCWNSYASVPRHDYCLVLDDTFDSLDNWNHEIQIGGFGTGAFDWTTNDATNSYISNKQLHIVPTLTTETTNITGDQILNGYQVNLTRDGTCTSSVSTDCAIFSNSSSGAIIPPVRSARLTTKGKFSITYGRVEVVAKLPQGDWLWPAIWMMPENSVYGAWPKSGEIDIMESRGNNGQKYNDGRDTVSSALHWGLDSLTDMYWQTTGKHYLRRTDYSDDFHTFGLEWSENYLYTYVDNRLAQTLYTGFTESDGNMWARGGFSRAENPWSQTGRYNTPFDQSFYLILNVAVGGTNGYFGDAVGQKPWVNANTPGDGTSAARSFLKAKSSWLPTWGSGDARGMTIKSVKMWQEGKC